MQAVTNGSSSQRQRPSAGDTHASHLSTPSKACTDNHCSKVRRHPPRFSIARHILHSNVVESLPLTAWSRAVNGATVVVLIKHVICVYHFTA
jgi:hypothetical protein